MPWGLLIYGIKVKKALTMLSQYLFIMHYSDL